MDRTDSKIDTPEAHARSLKVLQRLAAQVEHGDPELKGSRAFYLRKLYEAFTGGGKPN
jgi:hypothetical protein